MLAKLKDYSHLPSMPRIKAVETVPTKKKKRKPTMKDIQKLFRKLGVKDKKMNLDVDAFIKTLN